MESTGYNYVLISAVLSWVIAQIIKAIIELVRTKKFNVEMPIVEKVNEVLFDNLNAKEAVNSLMLRDKKDEYALAWSK